MNTNYLNICPSCIHRNTCVLTAQKDKVWSCSEFDEIQPNNDLQEPIVQPAVLQMELI